MRASPAQSGSGREVTALIWIIGSLLVVAIAVVMIVLLRRHDSEPRPPALPRANLPVKFLGRIVYGANADAHLRLTLDRRNFQSASFVQINDRLRVFTGARTPLVLLVTGAHQSTDPAKVAAMLAVTLARAGESVLVVDSDLRAATVEEVLGIEDAVGLSDVLAGVHSLDEAMVPWARGLVQVLPNGMMAPDPTSLLESDQWRLFVDRLRERFSAVIVHGSPVLASADAAKVASIADAVLLVTHEEQVALEDLAASVDLLVAAGIPALAYLTV
jgi:succinoglycan biosynthesis transport protein ExoP